MIFSIYLGVFSSSFAITSSVFTRGNTNASRKPDSRTGEPHLWASRRDVNSTKFHFFIFHFLNKMNGWGTRRVGGRSLFRFCFGTTAGLRSAVTNDPLWSTCKGHEKWGVRRRISNLSLDPSWLPASIEGFSATRRQMLSHFPTVTKSAGFQPKHESKEPALVTSPSGTANWTS